MYFFPIWVDAYLHTEPTIDSFSSSAYKAGTIPDVNMLLINSKKPLNYKLKNLFL